jgi:hypothetical protein
MLFLDTIAKRFQFGLISLWFCPVIPQSSENYVTVNRYQITFIRYEGRSGNGFKHHEGHNLQQNQYFSLKLQSFVGLS